MPTDEQVAQLETHARQVQKFLDGLGRRRGLRDRFVRPSSRVARSLQRMGVTGYRGRPYACPLANALDQKFPGHQWRVHVDHVEDGAFIPTPAPVADFIVHFDAGGFPDLVRK